MSYSNILRQFNRETNAEFFAWVKEQTEIALGRPITLSVDPPNIVPKWLYDLMEEMDDG